MIIHRVALWSALALLCCVSFAAHGGTCEQPGKELSRAEAANVRAACEYAAATVLTWREPEVGRKRLGAILADRFVIYTPTSDPARYVERSREQYLQQLGDSLRARYTDVRLEVLGTTAQGNRVATEMRAYFVGKDGVQTQDYHHQLLEFDSAGKIVRCKQYTDTARVQRQDAEASARLAEAFLKALSTGSKDLASSVLADDFTWTVLHADGNDKPMDKQRALQAIGGIPSVLKDLSVTALPDGITADADRVSVQAVSRGTHVNGRSYNNVYHFVMTIRDGRIRSIRQYSDIQYEAEVFSPAR